MPTAYDIIGDIHGCDAELAELLRLLGHGDPFSPHSGRMLVFVGDLVDRGPATPAVLERVMRLVREGRGCCVAGNHDVRLAEALRGIPVEPGHGLEQSLEQFASRPHAERMEVLAFLESLPGHLALDGGRLVVAHAGLEEALHGVDSAAAREAAIHGTYTGAFDSRCMPVRTDWANDYHGAAAVVHGHTPVEIPAWFHNTLCIDTGCVYGGRLTALRWPERELVAVTAGGTWGNSARGALPLRAQREPTAEAVPLPQGTATDAIRVLRRRAVEILAAASSPDDARSGASPTSNGGRPPADPAADKPAPLGRWLIHLPPTMSACDPGRTADGLEHPLGAFAHYASQGLRRVVCEEKHSGVRVVVILCRDRAAARRRFGADALGVIHSRAGRRFLPAAAEQTLLGEFGVAAEAAGVWRDLDTDWLCLDGELLGEPLAAATRPFQVVLFHLLAAERRTFFDRDHPWHLGQLARLVAEGDGSLVVTPHRLVDLTRPVEVAGAIAWWHALCLGGGEGIVVKPVSCAGWGASGPVQPALKVRGAEWLRRVYGDGYRDQANFERLRRRSLIAKRSRALGQFALGIEGLERFVEGAADAEVWACLVAMEGGMPEAGRFPGAAPP